jgi:hypothetical protein
VPIGDEDHGRVAVAIAVVASCGDQPTDLGIAQVFAYADSTLRRRFGGAAFLTVPLMVIGATSASFFRDTSKKRRFYEHNRNFDRRTRGAANQDRRHGSRGREASSWARVAAVGSFVRRFGLATSLNSEPSAAGAAAEPVSTQETPNWRAFSVGWATDAARASKGRQCTMAACTGKLFEAQGIHASPISERFFSKG